MSNETTTHKHKFQIITRQNPFSKNIHCLAKVILPDQQEAYIHYSGQKTGSEKALEGYHSQYRFPSEEMAVRVIERFIEGLYDKNNTLEIIKVRDVTYEVTLQNQ